MGEICPVGHINVDADEEEDTPSVAASSSSSDEESRAEDVTLGLSFAEDDELFDNHNHNHHVRRWPPWQGAGRQKTRHMSTATLEVLCHPSFICPPRSRQRMIREGMRAALEAARGGPTPQRLPDGTHVTAKYWGISRAQIKMLFQSAQSSPLWSDEDSVSTFVEKFVRPATDETAMGMSLHLNQNAPLEVNLMVSHAWIENAKDFFEDVLAAMADHEVAYICFLSNYQGTPMEIDCQLGKNIDKSPFTQVIRNPACQRMLVVPNEALARNGQGLYSRLWCDWEIKVAADAGIPIHIPTRNSLAHLLGKESQSSRFARCGNPDLPMNQDEELIRHAIESMPAETGRSHAISVSFVAVCAAYGPLIAYKQQPSPLAWILGLAGGLMLGMISVDLETRCVRPYRRDGYGVLDKVIKGAAYGWYSNRRFRAGADLIAWVVFASSCGLLDFLVRVWLLKESRTCALIGFVEGGGAGLLGYPMFDPNQLGPWTGVFITAPRARRSYGACLFLSCCIGGVVDGGFWRQRGDELYFTTALGRGALLGWLVGLVSLSVLYKQWRHVFSSCFMLVVMIFVRFVGSGVWRETFLMLLGLGPVQVRPDWGWQNRLALGLLQIAALSGMFLLGTPKAGMFDDIVHRSHCTS